MFPEKEEVGVREPSHLLSCQKYGIRKNNTLKMGEPFSLLCSHAVVCQALLPSEMTRKIPTGTSFLHKATKLKCKYVLTD